MEKMNESSLAEHLRILLEDETLEDTDGHEHEVRTVRTFNEAGVLTMNSGLVVRIKDGSEFQVTIVQSH
jgi:hypothetical protein